ncbi:MAG: hypothetical protein C0597_00730 [Marinilabiliales bacterium]|nr:MAG: hypothetical protein C0597_00730 [Marinilabiliales bacterium]
MNKIYEQYLEDYTSTEYSVAHPLTKYIEHYIYFSIPSEKITDKYFHPFPYIGIEIYLHLNKSTLIVNQSKKKKEFKNVVIGFFEPSEKLLIRPKTIGTEYCCMLIFIKLENILRFIDIPLYKLKNKVYTLSEIWKEQGKAFEEKILNYNKISQIIKCIDQFFINNLNSNLNDRKRRLNEILNFCYSDNTILTVDEICRSLQISYRTMYRIFKKEIGICPKKYLEIVRFNKVCNLLNKFPDMDWTELVYLCGYYDQSHFIHDFKSIMNCSPEKYIDLQVGKIYLNRPSISDN